MELTDIINCIVGALSLIVSVVAIIISINTTKRQTKMDLFNKRYDFYLACDIICGSCLIKCPDHVYTRLKNFHLNFSDYTFGSSKFLFDKKTAELILSIYGKFTVYAEIKYSMNELEKRNRTDDDLYTKGVLFEEEVLKFFTGAREELENRISKYLSISKK